MTTARYETPNIHIGTKVKIDTKRYLRLNVTYPYSRKLDH